MLALEPVRVDVDGAVVIVSRPTLLDLIDAIEINRTRPEDGKAWQLSRHAHAEDGSKLFSDIASAWACPAHIAALLTLKIETLYNEGRD
jgi:hypothetical protein